MNEKLPFEVCSNCGEALCNIKHIPTPVPHPGTVKTMCPRHYRADTHHSSPGYEHGVPANDACTRATLVKVTRCWECWLRIPGQGMRSLPTRCGHKGQSSDRPIEQVGSMWEQWFPSWCPLLRDGKPTADVRIVAIKEDEG